MRGATAGSWVMHFDVPAEPHVALFVRDTLQLDPEMAANSQPPPLESDVPNCSPLLSAAERRLLERSFVSWWKLSFTGPALIESGRPDDLSAGHRQLENWFKEFDAPLALHPELRRRAYAWFEQHREPYVHPSSQRDWKVSRDAARAAGAELGLDHGKLFANTWLLLVQGVWYATPKPGRLLFSPAVLDDTQLLYELLLDTFTSSARE